MKKVLIGIGKFFCALWGIVFLMSSLGGTISYFATPEHHIENIIVAVIFLIIGLALLRTAFKKSKKTLTTKNITAEETKPLSPSIQYIENGNIISHTDVAPITNEEVPYPMQLGYKEQQILFDKIPKYILDLLWIINKNCDDISEPSAIDTSLLISSENVHPNTSIGYYPSYRHLSPDQRYCYLNWLQNISQPVDIGYVFLFYYGLERHLFYGNFNAAYNTIKLLRTHHKNGSFQSYSSDALVLSAAYHKKYDLLADIDFSTLAPEIAIYLKSGMNIPISSDDLINIRKHIGFTNDRYIKENYTKFKDITDEILIQKYGCPSYPLSYNNFKTQNYYPVVLANYSLKNRIAFIPDISKISDFSSTARDILQSAHNNYKLSKHHNANNKCNRNNYLKQDNEESTDHNILPKKFATNIQAYTDMKIVSNTLPPKENYNVLNDIEEEFFRCFAEQLAVENLSPACIKLTRMSNGGFNVDYIGICYVGKINLYKPPTKYAVIKSGNKRATKVFNSLEDATEFVNLNGSEYKIQSRNKSPAIYMQYLKGQSTIRELYNVSLNECIEHIPDWIRYIKYCKRN